MHWAAMNGHTQIVELLLKFGAFPDEKDNIYGFTPLMLAARQGKAAIVQLLITPSCDLNWCDIHGETALFDAVRNNKGDCVELLINAGANINFCDKGMRTPLLTGVLWNRRQMVIQLIHAGCNLNTKGRITYFTGLSQYEQKFSPFEAAVWEANYIIAKILYITGCEITEIPQEYLNRWEEGRERQWLQEIMNKPRSLRQECRTVIRQQLGFRPAQKAIDLMLPVTLQTYLGFPELSEYT